jgi:hypothetical protein
MSRLPALRQFRLGRRAYRSSNSLRGRAAVTFCVADGTTITGAVERDGHDALVYYRAALCRAHLRCCGGLQCNAERARAPGDAGLCADYSIRRRTRDQRREWLTN